jgi:hypothetical protein
MLKFLKSLRILSRIHRRDCFTILNNKTQKYLFKEYVWLTKFTINFQNIFRFSVTLENLLQKMNCMIIFTSR